MPELDSAKMVILMGLRASGKSTLGAMLAAERKRLFIDLDDVTAATLREAHNLPAGTTIAELFASLGEAAFRRAEAAALRGVLEAGESALVVALGGGTPTAPGAAEMLVQARDQGMATLLYLRWKPETLAARLGYGDQPNRPALVGSDPASEVPAVFAQRDPLYRELASSVIELNGMDTEQALAALNSCC